MLGVHDASDYCFDEALALINKSVEYNPRLVGDLQQTRIYRAINAMDGEFDNALGLVKEAIGDIESRTEAFAKDQSYSNQYLHHLLLRSFWELDGMANLIKKYIDAKESWNTLLTHPWELINLYRALLLWSSNEESIRLQAPDWFNAAIEISKRKDHGATMRFIGAVISAVAACSMDNTSYVQIASQLLDEVQPKLPATAERIDFLREIISQPDSDSIDDVLSVLPFNYR